MDVYFGVHIEVSGDGVFYDHRALAREMRAQV